MSKLRKLTDKQERDVAIAYFCGVDTRKVAADWSISSASVTRSIAKNRSRTWNDSLVEFYRSRFAEEKTLNAAHLYLAMHGRYTPQDALIDRRRDRDAYDCVDRYVFASLGDEISRKVGLPALWKASQIGLELVVLRAVEGLTDGVFPYGVHPYIKPFLLDALEQAYKNRESGKDIHLPSISQSILDTVVGRIKDGCLSFTPRKEAIVLETFKFLFENGPHVLSLLYGFSGKIHTFEETAKELHITRERVRQIEARAIKKLQNSYILEILKSTYGLVTDQEVEECYWRAKLGPEIREKLREQQEIGVGTKEHDALPIEDLHFSIGTRNCLAKLGIKTAGELRHLTRDDTLKILATGYTSTVRELDDYLQCLGLAPLQKTE